MKILFFGIARDITGMRTMDLLEFVPVGTIIEFREKLEGRFPELGEIPGYIVAVNEEYVDDTTIINPTDQIAILPPVSGG